MDSEIIANAIRDPTEHTASEVMSNITPDIVSGIMPSIFGFTINGSQSSEVVAEQTLDQILTVVETKVLGEGGDFVIPLIPCIDFLLLPRLHLQILQYLFVFYLHRF